MNEFGESIIHEFGREIFGQPNGCTLNVTVEHFLTLAFTIVQIAHYSGYVKQDRKPNGWRQEGSVAVLAQERSERPIVGKCIHQILYFMLDIQRPAMQGENVGMPLSHNSLKSVGCW